MIAEDIEGYQKQKVETSYYANTKTYVPRCPLYSRHRQHFSTSRTQRETHLRQLRRDLVHRQLAAVNGRYYVADTHGLHCHPSTDCNYGYCRRYRGMMISVGSFPRRILQARGYVCEQKASGERDNCR